jgi:hypothetical protein
MRNPPLGQRIHQSNGNVFLPHNIRKTLGPVFSCKNLISHRKSLGDETPNLYSIAP